MNPDLLNKIKEIQYNTHTLTLNYELINKNRNIIKVKAQEIIEKFRNFKNILNKTCIYGNPTLTVSNYNGIYTIRSFGLSFINLSEICIQFPSYHMNTANEIANDLIKNLLSENIKLLYPQKIFALRFGLEYNIGNHNFNNTALIWKEFKKIINFTAVDIIFYKDIINIKNCSHCKKIIEKNICFCKTCNIMTYCNKKCCELDIKHNKICKKLLTIQ